MKLSVASSRWGEYVPERERDSEDERKGVAALLAQREACLFSSGEGDSATRKGGT